MAGDRHAYVPYWLVNGCATRSWIYVTADYRLIPEATAHDAVNDCVDAYKWITSSLATELGITLGPVLLSGSSAGGYLALTSASALLSLPVQQPVALLLIYGVLQPADQRYTTKGMSIYNRTPVDCTPVLTKFAEAQRSAATKVLSGVRPGTAEDEYRQELIVAFHLEALFPDYMTGVSGLGAAMARDGPWAIPDKHRDLYVVEFDRGKGLPPTILLHGQNDSAVPFQQSVRAAEGLEKMGVTVVREFPVDGEHGYDVRAGNVDVEKDQLGVFPEERFEALRRILKFLDNAAKNHQS